MVGDNGTATVRWGVPANYTVKSVTVNGVVMTPAEAGKLALSDINEDKNVVVTLERQTRNQPDSVPPTGFEPKFEVITDVSGYGGVSITSSNKLLEKGSSYNVSWETDEPGVGKDGKPINVPYIQWVKIDGEEKPELAGTKATAHSWPFTDIDGNHTVEVHTIMVNEDVDDDGEPDYNIDKDGDGEPDINVDSDGDGKPDVNIVDKDTDGDLKPDVNIDADGTNEWKPSSEGGNADKIWKPYLNIDTNDGKGPIHSDNTDPIDENNDGVDDRWVPKADTKADNGFEYDTLGENWVNDLKPGEKPEAPVDPDDPTQSDDPNKLPKPEGGDGENGSDNASSPNKGAGSMSATGDNTLAVSVLAMAAYTGLVVMFLARRRMNAAKKGGRHSL